MRVVFVFPLLAGMLFAQEKLNLDLSADGRPGVFARASALHFQEGTLPPGPVREAKFLLAQAAGNGTSLASMMWVKPSLEGLDPGCLLHARARASQTLFVRGEGGTISAPGRPGAAAFKVRIQAPADLGVILQVSFHGKVSAGAGSVTARAGNWKKTVQGGAFSFQARIPLALKKGIPAVLPFSLGGAIQSSGWAQKSYDAVLELRVRPVLSFRVFGKGCSGRIRREVPPEYGMPFRVTLAGGERSVPCFLVAGNSDKSFLGVPLPLDLGLLGSPGCFLYTNIVGAVPARTSPAGNASVILPIPPSNWAPLFPEVFLQWVEAGPGGGPRIRTSDAALLSPR